MKKSILIAMLLAAYSFPLHGDDDVEQPVPAVSEHHIYLKIVPPEGDTPLTVSIVPPEEYVMPAASLDAAPGEAAVDSPEDNKSAGIEVEAGGMPAESEAADSCLILDPTEIAEVDQMLDEMIAADTESKAEPPMGLLLFIFVLAIFLGFELISKVPSQLHTPLMSGSNAISGITIVGAMVAAGMDSGSKLTVFLGTLAVIFATINVVGGYLVTDRMLGMFKKKDGGKA
jgi:H+-translocating NAD(P) transhydrogenase subunit alpha